MAEIDLAALSANYHALARLAPAPSSMAVVKADAYGHGAVEVARALAREGCGHFGVATVDEARELRDAGTRADLPDGRLLSRAGRRDRRARSRRRSYSMSASIAALDRGRRASNRATSRFT